MGKPDNKKVKRNAVAGFAFLTSVLLLSLVVNEHSAIITKEDILINNPHINADGTYKLEKFPPVANWTCVPGLGQDLCLYDKCMVNAQNNNIKNPDCGENLRLKG